MLALLTIIGITALTSTEIEVQSSGNMRALAQSFHLAEAGLDRATARLSADPDWAGDLLNNENVFAGDNQTSVGSYEVDVFVDDPQPGQIRLLSTGRTPGTEAAVSTIEVVGISAGKYPPVFDYGLLACGNMHLSDGDNEFQDADVFVDGNLHAGGTGSTRFEDSDIQLTGNLHLNDGQILNGNVFVNGDTALQSPMLPNVGGDVTTASSITGNGMVTGARNEYVSPDPVVNLCDGVELAKLLITREALQDYLDNVDTTITGDFSKDGGTISLTGTVHVTGNLDLKGGVELLGDVIFIVDGNVHIDGPGHVWSNPRGSTVTMILPEGNLHIDGQGAGIELDGAVHIGTVGEDGNGLKGGNLHLTDADFRVNGTVAIAKGNLHASGSNLKIHYSPPTDPNITGHSGGFKRLMWREIRK